METITIKRTCKAAGLSSAAILLALLILVFPAVTAPVEAQTIALVRPEPAALHLEAGETATVEILVENARNLYGIDVRGTFDPAIIEIVDANATADGVQMAPGTFPKPDFVALNAADNAAGAFRFVVTQVNPTPPATGSGVVFSFQVRGRSGGSTDIAIELVEMSDRDGMLLAVTTGSAVVEVAGVPPTATSTRIVLQPTAESSAGASATPTGNASTSASPTGEAPTTPQSAATQQPGDQPPAAATIAATAVESGAAPSAPDDAAPASPPGASAPGVADPPPDGAANGTTNPAAAAPELAAAGDSTVPEGRSVAGDSAATGSDTAANEEPATDSPVSGAPPPAVIGDSAVPNAPAAAPPVDNNASNRSAAPIVIVGGVLALALAGILLARMRKRG